MLIREKLWLIVLLSAAAGSLLGACAPEMVPPPPITPQATSITPEVQNMPPAEIPPGSQATPPAEFNPRNTPAPGTVFPSVKPGEFRVDNLPAFEAVRAHILKSLGISPEELVLLSYEPVDWPDSCLGVPQLGTACMEVITPGYLLFFDTPQGKIEAHLDKSGRNFRLIPGLDSELKGLPERPPGTPGASGIRGQALVGPACPGPVSIDNPCPDQPLQATISVLGANGEAVVQFQTGADGTFQVELPPGTYTLHPESPGSLPYGIDQQITVLPGEYLELQVRYDSGIR